MENNEFIKFVGDIASEDMRRSGILASPTIAQAILESAYGTSELAVKGNALFGIKASNWTGKKYTKITSEFVNGKYVNVKATFRAYDSWEESIADHSLFLTGKSRYANLVGETDYKEACRKIQEDGYATSPTYAEKLIALIERYDLTKFDNMEVGTMKKVFIGVGHGGNDSGAKKILTEKDVNLVMALACRDYLERYGVEVKLSRTKDENDPIEETVRECNEYGPDLAVDIHNNAGGGDGFEVFHSVVGGASKALAKNIEAEVKKLGQNSRGVKTKKQKNGKDYYLFIGGTKAPAVICEGAFLDNATDVKAIDTKAEQKKFGEAYARGILKTLGITEEIKKEPVVNKTPFKVKVSIKDLNIRDGAGTNYGVNRVCPPGVYTITEVKEGKGSDTGWGRLKSRAGWISLDYVERV